MDGIFTQMIEKEGIKLFGEVEISAILKEFKHIDEGEVPGKPVVIPTYPEFLTRD